MTINSLSLPLDIPWRRLCVSDDMVDRDICDRRFPYRWRSSIALFSYEPPEEHQTQDGMILSYLKVTCTITGHQWEGADDLRIGSRWNDFETGSRSRAMMSDYYPCYGAILEVAVGPTAKHPPSSKRRSLSQIHSQGCSRD